MPKILLVLTKEKCCDKVAFKEKYVERTTLSVRLCILFLLYITSFLCENPLGMSKT